MKCSLLSRQTKEWISSSQFEDLQEKDLLKDRQLYLCFVDLEKAFNRVPRKLVEWSLRIKGVP